MRPTRAHFLTTITLAFCTLRCSNGGDTAPGGTAGTGNESSGHAGTAAMTAGHGGSVSNTAGTGGTNDTGTGGSAGSPVGTGGTLGAGTGGGGSSGTSNLGAGTGGGGPAGAGGRDPGGAGRGFGGIGGSSVGGMSGGTGPAMGGGGSGGSGGASLYAQVLDIIAKNCATNDCHQNNRKQHVNFHNTDGMLYQRLVSTTTTIPGAAGACAMDPIVVPGNPDASLIMKMIVEDDSGRTNCGKRMPDDCPDAMKQIMCLSDAQIETIRSWIAAGAPQS